MRLKPSPLSDAAVEYAQALADLDKVKACIAEIKEAEGDEHEDENDVARLTLRLPSYFRDDEYGEAVQLLHKEINAIVTIDLIALIDQAYKAIEANVRVAETKLNRLRRKAS
jgi:hypothetical protein